jgi:threonine synthase
MRYVSTRGVAPELGFGDVLLEGLARDGGLYVPTGASAQLGGSGVDGEPGPIPPYVELAATVMAPFVVPDMVAARFAEIVADAYTAFGHPDVVPLVELGDGLWVQELFHGPTLAFKDVALQLVGRLMDDELARRDERRTIVVATSGDTGSAAIDACVGRDRLSIVVLHPAGRTSEVQRRQMTTVDAPNVTNVAVEGTFDDCQDLVKAMFAHEAFRDELRLGAMNSINWGRVLAQIPYHVAAAAQLGRCVVSVPSGNFGNILAGWYAARLGAPIERFVVATNRNDILARWVARGDLVAEPVVATLSPSMDIQVSSNHERLLFELLGRDGTATAELLGRFRATGSVEAPRDPAFVAARLDDDETLAEIARVHDETGMLVDPHTAIGIGAARRARATGAVDPSLPVVCMATAHPAKFPDAVETATGIRPPLPARLADLYDRPERYEVVAAHLESVQELVRVNVAR